MDVSTWKNSNTPPSSSDIHLKLDQPIDLTGHILSPFFIREFNYQGCRFHSVTHLMCYRYAVLHGLRTFANAIRKWAKPLTASPPPATRHLTGRYSVVQYYGIYTVTCVWQTWQLRRPCLNRGHDLSPCHACLRGGIA